MRHESTIILFVFESASLCRMRNWIISIHLGFSDNSVLLSAIFACIKRLISWLLLGNPIVNFFNTFTQLANSSFVRFNIIDVEMIALLDVLHLLWHLEDFIIQLSYNLIYFWFHLNLQIRIERVVLIKWILCLCELLDKWICLLFLLVYWLNLSIWLIVILFRVIVICIVLVIQLLLIWITINCMGILWLIEMLCFQRILGIMIYFYRRIC
jgi:hypothetical protein